MFAQRRNELKPALIDMNALLRDEQYGESFCMRADNLKSRVA